MQGTNVVPLRAGQTRTMSPPPEQQVLFKDCMKTIGQVVFLDIDALSQEKIIALVNQNCVQTFLRIRKVPVFRRPKFNHKQLIDYLMTKNIKYIDVTAKRSRDEIADAAVALLASQPHPLLSEIAEALRNGVTVVLFEDNDKSRRSIPDIRNILSHLSSYRAELHPSGLVW